MQTWSNILAKSSALLNDQDRAVYTDLVLLPYLNMALAELQELFELNNISATSETSVILTIPVGMTAVSFITNPALPPDLVEIQQVYESLTGQNSWTPMVKKEYLTRSLIGTVVPVAQFGIWAYLKQEIRLLTSNQINDLKIDYICSLFSELTVSNLIQNNTIRNTDTFVMYRVAGLAAEFIDENFARAQSLNGDATGGLDRSIGIGIKGKQAITVRRRPFRAAYKRRRQFI